MRKVRAYSSPHHATSLNKLGQRAEMFHPTRGGTRGGAAEFSWDDVRKDKDRENYLGHSISAPTGRWQNHKDVNWYNKEHQASGSGLRANGAGAGLSDAQIARRQELQAIKEREQAEMERRLGRKPGSLGAPSASSVGDALVRGSKTVPSGVRASGANTTDLVESSRRKWGGQDDDPPDEGSGLTRDERRAARRLAKMQVRERRRDERHVRRDERRGERSDRGHEHRTESRREGDREYSRFYRRRSRSRSRSPDRRGKDQRDRSSRKESYDRSRRYDR